MKKKQLEKQNDGKKQKEKEKRTQKDGEKNRRQFVVNIIVSIVYYCCKPTHVMLLESNISDIHALFMLCNGL